MISPAQEPAVWAGAFTAALNLVVIFLPRFGVHLSGDEQNALQIFAAALIPLVLAFIVRQNVTPTANLAVKP